MERCRANAQLYLNPHGGQPWRLILLPEEVSSAPDERGEVLHPITPMRHLYLAYHASRIRPRIAPSTRGRRFV